MKEVVMLVSCSKAKAAGELPARELYQGELFKKASAFAELRGVLWFILSAKYGLVAPDQPIESYNTRLDDLSAAERDYWGETIVHDLTEETAPVLITPSNATIEIYAGELYTKPIKARLEALGFTVAIPLAGFGIGQQLHKLKLEVERLKPAVPNATIKPKQEALL